MEEMVHISFSGMKGDQTHNPWVGSQVFYHWAKPPNKQPKLYSFYIAKWQIFITPYDVWQPESLVSQQTCNC